jgi:hypothetical protein
VTDCSAPFGFVKMALAFDGVRPEDINDVSKFLYAILQHQSCEQVLVRHCSSKLRAARACMLT